MRVMVIRTVSIEGMDRAPDYVEPRVEEVALAFTARMVWHPGDECWVLGEVPAIASARITWDCLSDNDRSLVEDEMSDAAQAQALYLVREVVPVLVRALRSVRPLRAPVLPGERRDIGTATLREVAGALALAVGFDESEPAQAFAPESEVAF